MNIEVLVKPGAKGGDRVIDRGDGVLVVRTSAKAHDGEANVAVISLLAKHLGVAKSRLRIKTGLKSKHKVIVLE